MAKKNTYAGREALDPFFAIIQRGLDGLVDGEHFYDAIADDAVFEFLYDFPGWPHVLRGRAGVVQGFSGYGNNIHLHSSGGLVVHRSQDPRVVILEYEVHGKTVGGGAPYDNRFISVITTENKKIAHWRDYMDSLAAWRALNADRP
jgi:ketosteroid isomerase-like protein